MEDVSYFELKYWVIEDFYREAMHGGYSFGQIVGITRYGLTEYIFSEGIESIIVLSAIISLQIQHGVSLTDNDIRDIDRLRRKIEKIPVKTLLNADEYKYLNEDLQIIKKEYNKYLDEYNRNFNK